METSNLLFSRDYNTPNLFRKLPKKSLMCNMPALFQKGYPLWFITSLTLYREDYTHHIGTCWGFPCVCALETLHYYPMNIIDILSSWISSHLAMVSYQPVLVLNKVTIATSCTLINIILASKAIKGCGKRIVWLWELYVWVCVD